MSVRRAQLGAMLFISNQLTVVSDESTNPDLTTPDDVNVVWPLPRDAKSDVCVILKAALAQFGQPLGSIPVIKDGTFQASLLRIYNVNSVTDLAHATTTPQPVIQVARAADVARRISAGEVAQGFNQRTSAGGNIVTNSNTLPEDAEVFLRTQASDVTIEINIYDTFESRADQLYLLVKTVMFAAEKVFMDLGYLNVLRQNGVDNAGLTLDVPGGEALIFVRTLTYLMTHLDFIAGVGQLGKLIAQDQTFIDPQGGETTTESGFP
jgi:hypothetical protein